MEETTSFELPKPFTMGTIPPITFTGDVKGMSEIILVAIIILIVLLALNLMRYAIQGYSQKRNNQRKPQVIEVMVEEKIAKEKLPEKFDINEKSSKI